MKSKSPDESMSISDVLMRITRLDLVLVLGDEEIEGKIQAMKTDEYLNHDGKIMDEEFDEFREKVKKLRERIIDFER